MERAAEPRSRMLEVELLETIGQENLEQMPS